jgi:predicted transcriptional regulator of viral defense system
MKIKPFFETNPVFRYEEFAKYMQSQGVSRPASWRQQLSYHHKAGNLVHIRKFLYAVKPISVSEKDYWVDPYLIAGKSAPDAILAYHTAIELLGLAYSTFSEFIFVTSRPANLFSYEGQLFRPVLLSKSLIKQKKSEYGVETIERQGITIKMTGIERTIVDILDRPDLGGGWEEIWRSLDNVIQINLDKLIEYTLLLKNATVVAKVGYFLEQRPSHLAVDQKYLEKLLPYVPKQPHYMNRNRQGKGKYIARWQLIVPIEITERKWEEPNVEDI